jgi:hypothetical protein
LWKPFSDICSIDYCTGFPRQTAVASPLHDRGMTRAMRLEIFELEVERLLASDVEHDYVCFSDLRDPGRQVLFLKHDGTIYGSVAAAERNAATALGCLGFGRAGSSYSRDRLPADARKLACLAELVFGAAWGSVEGLTVLPVARADREASFRPAMELDA